MSSHNTDSNIRPAPDRELTEIADYLERPIESREAYDTARLCLLDSLGCALLALNYPDCVRHLGPLVPGTIVPDGVHVPGTAHVLDPVKAAFDIGTLVRWLDFNDTWLAAEWGHPSDNLGAILACAEYVSHARLRRGEKALRLRDVLTAMIRAHEIQGVMALENAFNRVGLDHVVLVKLASTAVATAMLGGNRQQVIDALSQVWVDGQALRTYRHAPNTGSRKSWAAGDATSRAVRLALMTLQGEMGYPSALSAKGWGFYDVSFKGNRFKFQRPYGSYVMEQVLFKISFPAEFHAQTAVECAVRLHPVIANRLDDIERIALTTHESAIRIISKTGPLHNYADRDHCLQYMVAVGLLHGALKADHYKDETARDPRIDALRAKMEVVEDPRYSREYHDPAKRAIANAIQIFFRDGSASERLEVEYPIGHRRRRAEGIPLLIAKFRANATTRFAPERVTGLIERFNDIKSFDEMPVREFMDLFLP